MILADKIINERKKNGWSQEELAEKLSVSRQSVSKWEGAQSMPDLGKVLQMAQLFGVSTDYLLKDEMEPAEIVPAAIPSEPVESVPPLRKVSMEEAQEFLHIKEKTVPMTAAGVTLCILSPAILLLLIGMGEIGFMGITENLAVMIGLVGLLVMVAIAVGIFMVCGGKLSEYEFLEKEEFETEYGVTGMVKEKKAEYKGTATLLNTAGVVLCILCPVPLIAAAVLEAQDVVILGMVDVLLVLVATAVNLFIRANSITGAYQMLLCEGEYAPKKKRENARQEALSSAYWLTVTAIYLGISFWKNNWGISWIIWPVAAVLFGAVSAVFTGIIRKEA